MFPATTAGGAAGDLEGRQVVVITTGVCNTASIISGLKKAGAVSVETTSDPAVVRAAGHVVVPGVGSFAAATLALQAHDMLETLRERIAANKPTLLVCVGFQLLADGSEESPGAAGLGVVPVRIQRFSPGVAVPQQGWNDVTATPGCKIVQSGVAYFSNSFCMRAMPLGWTGATSQHGVAFVSALERGNVVALQFHPELSGEFGINLLARWMNAVPATAAATTKPVSGLKRRVVPCLDVRDGVVVKGVKFQGLTEVGNPAAVAKAYYEQGADELTMLDVSATGEKRKTCADTVRAIRASINMPLTVGGGVNTVDDVVALLEAGADKVSMNTAAVKNPKLLGDVARRFGSQCTVLAIDAVADANVAGKWEVVIKSGKERTGLDAVAWAQEGVRLGAGEVLLTSFDRDGTRSGYDLALLAAVSAAVPVPVVASGGANSAAHMNEAFMAGADAALAASIFHYKDTTVGTVKDQLATLGSAVRITGAKAPTAGGHDNKNRQCLVPSIDILGGRTVQLVGGDPGNVKVDAGAPGPLAAKLGLAGEIAVVDLDAALGKGDNRALIESLLPIARCRVGGGIRTVDAALRWLNAGAAKVVIGTAATPDFLSQLPRDRVVVALDARHGEVVVNGWTVKSGKSIIESVRELRPFAGAFLVTFVEREGRMVGIDVPTVKSLVDALDGQAQLTVAGGVTTEADIATLDALGVEAQVGMALYTNRLDLGKAIAAPLTSDRPDGLFPTVVVDTAGVCLGLCYSSRESISEAVKTQRGVYQSRTRGLWVKGASSGDTQELLSVSLDCDRDTLRFVVAQRGNGFCHRSTHTCFGDDQGGLAGLMRTLRARLASAPAGSYTKRLFDDELLLSAKLREEACELAEATTKEETTWEAADVFYFALVACVKRGVTLRDVEQHLDARALKVTRRRGDAKPQFLKPAAAPEEKSGSSTPSNKSDDSFVKVSAAATTDSSIAEVSLKRLDARDVRAFDRDPVEPQAREVASAILEQVAKRGEEAVREYAEKFGDIEKGQKSLFKTKEELREAFLSISPEDQALLQRTAQRIRAFATAQKSSFTTLRVPIAGGEAGHDIAPVDIAGCYAPGGRYPLPSTVLMTAVTARVAGCKQVWVSSPHPTPIILAAAHVAEADGVMCIGGVQAIAAMTYGCGAMPRCDAIVGPGNKYVTAAKSLVSGRVAIDMLAGPSECLVLADETANPEVVAADLIAQAEHDTAAVPILVSLSDGLVAEVEAAMNRQLASLSTAATARVATNKNGFAVVCTDMTSAIKVCDLIAPEHLEVMTTNSEQVSRRLSHYGALFIGQGAAEVLGDYGAGPNHTLPTGGTARFTGGLSVMTFTRLRTWMRVDNLAAAAQTVFDATQLGKLEGLFGHAAAAAARSTPNAKIETGILQASTATMDSRSAAAATENTMAPKVAPTVVSHHGGRSYDSQGFLVASASPQPTLSFTTPAMRLALPKGHIMKGVMSLMKECGITFNVNDRNLRPSISLANYDVKMLNPRNVVEMLHHGTRDIGFVGIDLIKELNAKEVIPYFDLGLDPVRIVVAAPPALLVNGLLPKRHLLIASEYPVTAQEWIERTGMSATIIRTYGSTEVFPPEDADLIVDNCATGNTLKANGLNIVGTIGTSSTHLCVHPSVLQDPLKKLEVDRLVVLLKSALAARTRTLVDFNVSKANLDAVLPCVPAMGAPTVSPLADGDFAVRAAIPKNRINTVVPQIKEKGATSIILSSIQQLID